MKKGEARWIVERLISLFRALENEYVEEPEPQRPEELPGLDGEPEYFVQLMQYLRERNSDAARSNEHDEHDDEEKTVQTVGSHR